MQERLTAGNPQRLLQAETELLLLLRILHDESVRRQEAPSLTTLKHKKETDNKSSECLFEYVSVCECSTCVYTSTFIYNREKTGLGHVLSANILTNLFQPVWGDNGDSFSHRTQELDGPAHLISHQTVHVGHTFSHAAS